MTHHAYLLIAERDSGIAHARELFGVSSDTHPDVQVLSYELFGIDDARALKEHAFQRPVAGDRRVFIVTCTSLSHETQNALLKLFEEPPQTAAFALVLSREDLILPTLRSRFEVVRLHAPLSEDPSTHFLAASFSDRLEEVAKRTKAKDVPWQRALLAGLERHFHSVENAAVLRDLVWVETQIGARGASPKMLLEHVALSLPRGG